MRQVGRTRTRAHEADATRDTSHMRRVTEAQRQTQRQRQRQRLSDRRQRLREPHAERGAPPTFLTAQMLPRSEAYA